MAAMTAPSGDINAATVVAAEEAARVADDRVASLQTDLEVKRRELATAAKQVEQAEERKRQREASGASANSSVEEALEKLRQEEAQLHVELEVSPHKEMLAAFVARQREMEDEERSLLQTLQEHETALAELRGKLAHPPAELLPRDEARAQLYVMWKRALAEREELLRQARGRKHELMKDLKARHESQVVLLELERRAAVEALKETVRAEKQREAARRDELAAVEKAIEQAHESMAVFQKEFDQLRVALLMDRMAKNEQVAGLLAQRQHLANQAQAFQSTIEAAKLDAAEAARREWDAKLAAEEAAGEERLREEAAAIEEKMGKVREALTERYEKGFTPLLQEAEARHLQEVNRVTQLQQTLAQKEKELQRAHEMTRRLASQTMDRDEADDSSKVADDATPDDVAEFERLRSSLDAMWEQLDMPAADIVSFLSECDMIAPFNRHAYNLYVQYHAELSGKASADSPVASSPPSRRAASSAVGTPESKMDAAGTPRSASSRSAASRAPRSHEKARAGRGHAGGTPPSASGSHRHGHSSRTHSREGSGRRLKSGGRSRTRPTGSAAGGSPSRSRRR